MPHASYGKIHMKFGRGRLRKGPTKTKLAEVGQDLPKGRGAAQSARAPATDQRFGRKLSTSDNY